MEESLLASPDTNSELVTSSFEDLCGVDGSSVLDRISLEDSKSDESLVIEDESVECIVDELIESLDDNEMDSLSISGIDDSDE